ncbi:CDP-diacylglycerol--glycerol-3-phosphate 3-phosphatidyltransferase [Candidatus Liberibacter africanus]|uniref:CDP-diacylglycerol--glycerol-3-phosphate 3-phosphatidyltransferase n=1 Tax=Candidatus Liberibacter africanus PTSAPSY TaxID=1277257 RepID=A0A0G3I955_LIBAF|nr:CDP-diacylglycerol--glycerol-3-phosphate 3-phosphatidyltransferase [Candidatus Liberibacter africanus]AKK20307.1 CDP-diacylglycerol/glycerol-3-phosphate 3-phosphatidyltransferase [Candidatus Liberibacter africanus PTSAPSY]QTP64061.1 CDP-diacylglycerol--glycerol-3-phosphate 3-phosphatidyltransferase [Candidatus Liberibacter africanus]
MASRSYNIPNMLTYGRILVVPLIVLCFFVQEMEIFATPYLMRWIALSLFTIASITDFFDGYLARIWNQTSNIGRMLDPIADKLLISSVLLLMTADGTINSYSTWAAITILCREILVSGLREYLAELQVSVPVTRIARIKTAIQMISIGFLLTGPACKDWIPYITETGTILLWISALMTIYSGYDYFRVGIKHIDSEDES